MRPSVRTATPWTRWSSDGSQSGIYHVAIYLGDDQMIEAPTFGMTVRVTSMRYSGVMPYAVRF